MSKHMNKITMSMTDEEFARVVRWAGRDDVKRSIWCRETIMEHLDQKDAELHCNALAAGYRLVPLEAGEAGEAK